MTYIVRRKSPELAHLSQLDPLQVVRDPTGWDPYREMTPFIPFVSRPLPAFAPQFEVKETKDAFIFRADLPGVEEKNIEVSLTGNLLTVNGLLDQDRRKGEGGLWGREGHRVARDRMAGRRRSGELAPPCAPLARLAVGVFATRIGELNRKRARHVLDHWLSRSHCVALFCRDQGG